jgi:hypothetical protein
VASSIRLAEYLDRDHQPGHDQKFCGCMFLPSKMA